MLLVQWLVPSQSVIVLYVQQRHLVQRVSITDADPDPDVSTILVDRSDPDPHGGCDSDSGGKNWQNMRCL